MSTNRMQAASKEFIKTMRPLTGRRSEQEAFDAFLEIGFTAAAYRATTGDMAETFKARHLAEWKRWNDAEHTTFLTLMQFAEENISGFQGDLLGVVAAEIGALSAARGQFFTPWELCLLMAAMTLAGPKSRDVVERGWVGMQEPACGSGAIVLAKAKAERDAGLDIGTQFFAECIDISERAFKMCYIQLCCNGVPAIVKLGNALSSEPPSLEVPTPFMPRFLDNVRAFRRGAMGAGKPDPYAEFTARPVPQVRKRVRVQK